MRKQLKYDVIVVGGSIGGCTAATLYARAGLRVALLEQTQNPGHYKKACTHFVQPAATRIIRKLGLDKGIEAAGGIRNDLEVWTRWGWIRGGDSSKLEYGYSIRRQTLDPMLRELAAGTAGVEFFPGTSATALLRDAGGRINGVAANSARGRQEFQAPLLVAADGRLSGLAELAGVKAHQHYNDRCSFYTYYRGVSLNTSATSRYWSLDPNLAYAFHNDDDTTVMGIYFPRSKWPEFKVDPMGNFRRFWEQVPDAPRIGNAKPLGELRGFLKICNQWRPAAAPGIAFVGDAAMVLDPLWGTGCGFAFQSADWLVDATLPAFGVAKGQPTALDRCLERYRKQHRARTWQHYAHIASYSKGHRLSLGERLVFSAAARDSKLARRMLTYMGRTVGPLHAMGPSALLRAVMVNLGYSLFGRTNLDRQANTAAEERPLQYVIEPE
jgi:menaquinone-9 beta-reductase